MTKSMDEQLLLSQAKRGDRTAFVKLYRNYYNIVYRFCLTFGKIDADTAKDILQESFIRAFRNIEKLREDQKFLSWLLTITKNRCLSHMSREDGLDKKHKAWSQEQELFLAPSEHDYLETERQIATVQETIQELPEGGMKDCAQAFYVEGLSTSDIAQRLDIPKSTVTTRLDRFRGRIRKQLIARLLDDETKEI